MKLSLSQADLLAALQVVSRAVSTRTAIPALSGILVDASSGGVRLAATDTELGVQITLAGQAEQEGEVVLPGRLLLEVVRSLGGGTVGLELRPEQRDVEVTGGAARFHLRTLARDDFPRLPALDGDVVKMPSDSLVQTIDRVARAASRDEARPILTGILVSAEGKSLVMVATDSYRLSVKQTVLEGDLSKPVQANVPARALQELSRLIASSGADEVSIALGENQVVFEVGGAVLSSRLIEGQFPNYRQLVPESFEHEVRLPREDFLEAVRRVGLMAQKNVPLKLSVAEGELTVSAETPDVGEASETLPANFSGEGFEIGFNPDFLREGIESVDSEELLLKLITPLRPGLLRAVESEDYLYLIMPIRLNV